MHAHPDDETIGTGAIDGQVRRRGRPGHAGDLQPRRGGRGARPGARPPGLRPGRHCSASTGSASSTRRCASSASPTTASSAGRAGSATPGWRPTGRATRSRPRSSGPDTFWAADLLEASDLLVEIIREVRPQVLVTYDQHGGYGHPDHIQSHRVAMYASQLAAAPSYRPRPGRGLGHRQDLLARDVGEPAARGAAAPARLGRHARRSRAWTPTARCRRSWSPDRFITAEIDAGEYVHLKMDAMKAHATQITLDGPFFALSNNKGNEVWGRESFRLVKGVLGRTGRRARDRPVRRASTDQRGEADDASRGNRRARAALGAVGGRRPCAGRRSAMLPARGT